MRPQWFSIQNDLLPPRSVLATVDHAPREEFADLPPIPLKQMWADDEFWLVHEETRVDIEDLDSMLDSIVDSR